MLIQDTQQLTDLQHEWRQAWKKKTAREFDARLRQLARFVEEWRDHLASQMVYYATEVRLCVLLERLTKTAEQRAQLTGLYGPLCELTVESGFVWDAEAESAFPADIYWHFCRRPKLADQN